MHILCLFYFTITAQIIAEQIFPITKIVGGSTVPIEKFPYQLAILVDNDLICAATLISHNRAITAAHCFIPGQKYKIRAGSNLYKKGGVVVSIEKYIKHPKFNRIKRDYDISIIYLDKSLSYSKKIQPVKLPDYSETVPANLIGVASGWGKTGQTKKDNSFILRAVHLPVVDWKLCQSLFTGCMITEQMICAGFVRKGGKDTCQGDSGGPFVVDGVLYGIVSWGFGCAKAGFPGVYTNVPLFIDFIKETAGI